MKLFGRKIPLIYLNLAGFVLGCLAGLALYKFGLSHSEVLDKIIAVISPFGNVLVNMLKMIVIPIIFFSLVCGAATMPAKSFGKMGLGVCVGIFLPLSMRRFLERSSQSSWIRRSNPLKKWLPV